MFKPTKPQLKKLAKVAKVETYLDSEGLMFYIENGLEDNVDEYSLVWQPHEDRDQLAMVIEGLTDEQLVYYNGKLFAMFITSPHPHRIPFGQTVHPSISCEKLLEVIG